MLRKTLGALALCFAIALPAFAATPVNINSADAKTIAASLDGIGLGKARAIVAWRSAHGPFKKVTDLGKVKGIGPKTLARNRSAILLADRSDAKAGAPAAPAASKPATSAGG